MRSTHLATSICLAAGLVALGGAPALAAGTDRFNCDDFSTQQEAQIEYQKDTSDPSNLDNDGDGVACENNPDGTLSRDDQADKDSTDEDMAMPKGGVDAGAGGLSDPTGLYVSGGLLAAAGAGGLLMMKRRTAHA